MADSQEEAGFVPTMTRQLTAAADDPDVDNAPMDQGGVSSPDSQSHLDYLWQIRLGGLTDPGVPGKTNQDDYFVWDARDGNSFIIAVFDGHGKELGTLAAQVAKHSLIDNLCNSEAFAALRKSPEQTFRNVFATAHTDIEKAFRQFYQNNGWIVSRSAEGFLTRQRSRGSTVLCVHGGTTATVIAVIDGRWAVVGNVGDSTGIVCGGKPQCMRNMSEWPSLPPLNGKVNGGLVVNTPARNNVDVDTAQYEMNNSIAGTWYEVSADHSPENVDEFYRIRKQRPHPGNPAYPELSFVYDSLSSSKARSPAIYECYEGTDGSVSLRKSERGSYYKNVRNEWATLVATPPNASFQDALAFTRSLGDLHLQVYGVSYEPAVRWCDLWEVEFDSSRSTVGPIVLALCSDGVWDNWKYSDVSQFTLHPGRVEYALRHETAQACCVDLMQANLERARVNFGHSADNMSVVLAYLIPHKERLRELKETRSSSRPDSEYNSAGVGTGTGASDPHSASGMGTGTGTGTGN